MCGNVWRWPKCSKEKGNRLGGGLLVREENARGAQENLWPKSFLERPVARHFVCHLFSIWHAVCKLLKTHTQQHAGFVGIALERERFTPA